MMASLYVKAGERDGDYEAAAPLYHGLHLVLREDHVHGRQHGAGGQDGRSQVLPHPPEVG